MCLLSPGLSTSLSGCLPAWNPSLSFHLFLERTSVPLPLLPCLCRTKIRKDTLFPTGTSRPGCESTHLCSLAQVNEVWYSVCERNFRSSFATEHLVLSSLPTRGGKRGNDPPLFFLFFARCDELAAHKIGERSLPPSRSNLLSHWPLVRPDAFSLSASGYHPHRILSLPAAMADPTFRLPDPSPAWAPGWRLLSLCRAPNADPPSASPTRPCLRVCAVRFG